MGWDLTGAQPPPSWAAKCNPGAAFPSWAPSGNLPPITFSWSLSWRKPFLPLLGKLRQLLHPALNPQRLPHLCTPTGSRILYLSTRAPSPDPAGTSSLLLGQGGAFTTHLPWFYTFPSTLLLSTARLLVWLSTALIKSVLISMFEAEMACWRSWYPRERHSVTQHACHELMSGVGMKPTALAVRLRHREGCQLPAKSSLMDQCCQHTLSPASWPVIGTWGCAVLFQ